MRQKLASAQPPNDGKQTPMRGHPVFKAQHATATCCRGCMNKWWKIPKGVDLSAECQQKEERNESEGMQMPEWLWAVRRPFSRGMFALFVAIAVG